jgi:glycosyltransferase involved in cell wall biosynthesis
MKILFLYDFPLWGNGSGVYLRNLVEQLVCMDHEVGIIAPENRRFLENKIKQYKVDPPQIPVFVGHPELKGAKRYSELSPREITDVYQAYLNTTIEAIFNFEPDVIHVNHLAPITWVARYVSALMDVKYIITTHGSCLTNTLENKQYMPLTEDAVRHSKAMTMVSKNTKDRFFEAFDEDMVTRSRIIPGGVDISNFPKKVDTSHIEEKYNLKGKNVIFFAGRISPEKGMEYLVEAADRIDGEIFIAGEGPKRKDLEKIIAKKNLGNVHLLGYLLSEELIPFYYRADLFVSPSVVAEAFGLAILEAMAARTPVVTTNKGALPLLVKEGKNGLFVKAKNSTDIAEKCNQLLADKEKLKEMGLQARKDIEEKFTCRKVAERFEFLYKIVTGDYYRERKKREKEEKRLSKMKKKELIKEAEEKNLDFNKSKITKKEILQKLIKDLN